MTYSYNPLASLGLDKSIPLDGSGKIPSGYLPSYVDDVVEYDDLASFPGTGETGKIYVAKDTGYTYRWTGSVYVRIGSGGEVELNLGSEGSPSLYFTGDTNTGIYSPGADQLALSTNGTGRLFIDASGLVGIGTSSPGSYDFDGPTTLAAANTAGSSTVAIVSDATSLGQISFADGTSGTARYRGLLKYNHSTDSFEIRTAATPAITIDSSQRVGIGTTSPGSPLHVNPGAGNSGNIRVDYGTGSTADGYFQMVTASDRHYLRTVKSGGGVPLAFEVNSAERARIDSSGRLLVGTSSDSGGALLQVNGDRIRVATAKTPASASDTGTTGEICWDASYIYVCTATNTWKRAALSTW